MLESVDVGRQSIGAYEETSGGEIVARLQSLAEPLRGLRVLHLNATPYGGGVAEILRSEVPLLRDLGLAADWKVVTGAIDGQQAVASCAQLGDYARQGRAVLRLRSDVEEVDLARLQYT